MRAVAIHGPRDLRRQERLAFPHVLGHERRGNRPDEVLKMMTDL